MTLPRYLWKDCILSFFCFSRLCIVLIYNFTPPQNVCDHTSSTTKVPISLHRRQMDPLPPFKQLNSLWWLRSNLTDFSTQVSSLWHKKVNSDSFHPLSRYFTGRVSSQRCLLWQYSASTINISLSTLHPSSPWILTTTLWDMSTLYIWTLRQKDRKIICPKSLSRYRFFVFVFVFLREKGTIALKLPSVQWGLELHWVVN